MQVQVLTEIKSKKLDKTFTYKVPLEMEDLVSVGQRVLIPFGSKELEGFILKIEDDQELDYEIKDIKELIDDIPILNDEMLELGSLLAKRTFSSLMSIYETMLPKAYKAKSNYKANKKYVTYVVLNKEDNNVTGKQKEIFDLVKNGRVLKKEAQNVSLYAYKKLKETGVIKEIDEEVYRLCDDNCYQDKDVVLNDEQNKIVNLVKDNLCCYKPYLLYGVTGSGKTEVYMHIISEVLNSGKEALILVPEISLTPQLTGVFKARFKSNIAIMHSRLSDGERYDEYRKILRREVKIVIGARSAVFAPLNNLGIIIIDEEHSQTYKQENNPTYNAIDVALYRAKKHDIPVIMGSATPSIESFTKARLNKYELLTLRNRVNNTSPKVHIVDMQKESKKGNKLISKELLSSISDRLDKKEQVILLLNRRGYNTITTCHDCGYVDKCPNCDIPLIYHKSSNTMRCHYCGYGARVLTVCPECNSKNINMYGIGTQKLEEEIKKLFPNSSVVRMDVDSTSKKGMHEKIINDFRDKKYDILIGTQMIAKGLDFDNVTLVGVINGDASLNIPDFRSSERTFQLLNQVCGRTGRSDKEGVAFIQSFNTDHYSIRFAASNDYESFYNYEMNIRKKLKYPPFLNLALIKFKGKDYDLVSVEANKVKSYFDGKSNIQLLGPTSASMLKVNNVYNIQIIIKYRSFKDIDSDLLYVYNKYKANNKVNVDIDINPVKI
ncbi:MAG: primosomal protein N' [Bacilli bacterium]|nr:primosomal protein N' [Bacilli bacterium]